MRAAKRGDYRRALSEKQYQLVLGEFVAPDVVTAALAFSRPITVICGPNGAGKTRLLKALAQTLGCAEGVFGAPLSAASAAALRYLFQGTATEVVFSPAADHRLNSDHGRAYLLEPPHYAMAVLEHLRGTANLEEMLEAYAPVKLPAADVDSLSYLVNRKYDDVQVYEVDDPGGTPRTPVPLPYFRVSSLGRSYGSESMGLGELSVFCLWWNLSGIENGSIVLVDEPEAFASPHSQYALVDELVKRSVQKELTVILSTQSQPIIDSMKEEHIRVLVPGVDGVSVLTGPPKPTLLNTLGMMVPKQGLLLVEDELSAVIAVSAIGIVAADVLHVIEVVKSDGTGPLDQALTMPRFGNKWFHLVGVFDGDQRGVARPAGLQWPYSYLPGGRPEAELRTLLQGQVADAAAVLGRTRDQVQMAIAQTAGADDHDWLPQVAAALGLAADQVVIGLVRLWVARDRATFVTFANEIRNHVSR